MVFHSFGQKFNSPVGTQTTTGIAPFAPNDKAKFESSVLIGRFQSPRRQDTPSHPETIRMGTLDICILLLECVCSP